MELNEEQYAELKQTLSEIGAYLPENKTNYIWNTFNAIRDEHEVQPCTCASSGKHWKRAIDSLHEYVTKRG